MKLISMTDFVLEQTGLLYKDNPIKLTHKIINYAQFLKQPLTVDMFIGDKALFEGCYTERGYLGYEDYFICQLNGLKEYIVEDLLIFCPSDLELTDHALKQLGL